MANEQRTISGNVSVVENTAERVAYDLMRTISDWESAADAKKSPEYWLRLYRKCYLATSGMKVDRILEGD